MADADVLKLVVLSPAKKLVETTVSQVVLPGYGGELGVLPGHAAMVLQLGYGVLNFTHEGTRTYFAVEGGVAEIRDDVVTVLADSAEEATTIDAARAEKALQRAKERRGGSKAGEVIDMERASRAEARALARLEARARVQMQGG